jgi:hypothetical protein
VAKGWDRLSIAANTRPIRSKRRNVTQDELLVPDARSRLVLFAGCLACGAMLSVLWGFFGLMLLTLALGLHGAWIWWGMLAIAVVSTPLLFAYASWERSTDREWLERF